MAEKKSRFFACVTYIADTGRVLEKINNKRNSIRAFALVKHDKDEADIHHHIVIRAHSSWSCTQISKWFADEVSGQNTFVQFVHDRTGVIEYLTHKNEVDKHQYNESDIIDGGISDIVPSGETSDDTYEIIDKMIAGVPTRELVRLYGRDFVYHYSCYSSIVERIRFEEDLCNK